MAKTAKHLEVQARHIYYPEIEICPHCGDTLQACQYYVFSTYYKPYVKHRSRK
jgi:hypothetical protein